MGLSVTLENNTFSKLLWYNHFRLCFFWVVTRSLEAQPRRSRGNQNPAISQTPGSQRHGSQRIPKPSAPPYKNLEDRSLNPTFRLTEAYKSRSLNLTILSAPPPPPPIFSRLFHCYFLEERGILICYFEGGTNFIEEIFLFCLQFVSVGLSVLVCNHTRTSLLFGAFLGRSPPTIAERRPLSSQIPVDWFV